MTYTSFSNINSLEEFSFIAGSQYTLDFTVYESDGFTPMGLGGATIYWVLAPYGQPDYRVAKITASITGTNTFTVTIPSATTATFSGKYIHQPVIISFAGKVYYPCQGIILILSKISYA
jgi:hypothetical protein